jgi:ATP-dependent DNA helicase RecG
MIALCRQAGLPEPDFEERHGSVVVTLWRDWLTDEVMAGLELHDRQRAALSHVKSRGRISNSEYQDLTGAGRKMAFAISTIW